MTFVLKNFLKVYFDLAGFGMNAGAGAGGQGGGGAGAGRR